MISFKSRFLACALTLLGKYAFAVTPAISKKAPSVNGKKSYVAIMSQTPIIAYTGDEDGLDQTKPKKGEKINPNDGKVKKYKKYLNKKQRQAAESAGISDSDLGHQYVYSLNGFQAFLTEEEAAELRQREDIVQVFEDKMRHPTTDSTPEFLGLTDPAGPWARGCDGEDVVIGVIDTGIWPEHPSFADDGTYAALTGFESVPCDFGNTARNPADIKFACNNKLLGARNIIDRYRSDDDAEEDEFDSARDEVGHGSHVASTAAGNAGVTATVVGTDQGKISGVAPRARVIAYKACGKFACYSSDLTAAIDQAVEDGVDVINYSIGSSSPALSPDGIAFLFAADAGVFVATSAGNSGRRGQATIGSPATVPWITSVGSSTQRRSFQGSASSSDDWEFFGASITSGTDELHLVDAEYAGSTDAVDAESELCYPEKLDPSVVGGKIVLCKRGIINRVDKSRAVYLAGGAGMILYNANDSDSQDFDSHWVASVHINNSDGLAIKDYIESSLDPVAQINGGEKVVVNAPVMAVSSSRGPDRLSLDIIKPDITAPGVQILAATSPAVESIGAGDGESFAFYSGTSMSSPHIAGIFALVKQAHPDWTPAMAKSAIMTTARQDVMKEDGITSADPFDFGSGHLAIGGMTNKGSPFHPGLVYDAGLFQYAAFTCGAELGVFPPVYCESIGMPTEAYNLNYPSIGVARVVGSKTVTRTVTSVANENGFREYEAIVGSPEGFDVTVDPPKLRLKLGGSATFEVTMSHTNSPLNEWAFGSLTAWVDKSGNYKVRSPLAVKAIKFDYPAEINASGGAVEASFDVAFGYDGSYEAEAHGLESATVTIDNVAQDSFDGQNFELSEAFFFRIAMPPEAVANTDIDIDIYVLDPTGAQVASSTNVGTNELIDIASPMDGTWTVYIYGWDTVETSADYVLYTWVVSETPGGNMAVYSAPTSAQKGEIGTIDLSWTGDTAGEWHLGAISHNSGDELLGLTLVNVDNRGASEPV